MVGLAKNLAKLFLNLAGLGGLFCLVMMARGVVEGAPVFAIFAASLPYLAGLAFFVFVCAFGGGVLELLEKQSDTLAAIRRGQGQTAKAVRDLGADDESGKEKPASRALNKKSRGSKAAERDRAARWRDRLG